MPVKVRTVSRMIEFTDRVFVDDGKLREGDRYEPLENVFGMRICSYVARYHLGKLWGINGLPAAEFSDGHSEYFTDGKLDNTELDEDGNRIPAIISPYNEIEEFWEHGIQTGFSPISRA